MDTESSDPAEFPPRLRDGLERLVWPSGNGKAIVTRTSSDATFGAEALGSGGGIWMTLLCYLNEYNRNKNGPWLIFKIIRRMLFTRVFRKGALPAT